jgi:hypothetical protein
MILVAWIAFGMALADFLTGYAMVDGQTNVRVTFIVVDSGTGQAINDATIRISDLKVGPRPYTVTTDAAGHYVQTWRCWTTTTGGLLTHRTSVGTPWIGYRVFAPLHESTGGNLDSYSPAIKAGYPISTLDVKISLRRTPLDSDRVRPKAPEKAR